MCSKKNNKLDLYNNMIGVMQLAIRKSIKKVDPQNNYVTNPWDEFDEDFLIRRLNNEFQEFNLSGNKEELLDIINIATFLYKQKEINE